MLFLQATAANKMDWRARNAFDQQATFTKLHFGHSRGRAVLALVD